MQSVLWEVLRGSVMLGNDEKGVPSVPRTPTSPMWLVGNSSFSTRAQVHPRHEEGRSDERGTEEVRGGGGSRGREERVKDRDTDR